MATDKKPTPTEKPNISINGDVKDSTVIIGDNNVIKKTTIIQKFFNIFKSDSETLEHRNRRILLGHVENAWIKGVLDASLHGAALLDLGIKQDPEAVTKYPWAIKKESTDETLPAGTSMLEIFDSIGMGRSLLILGAPGSGKTTMLLELARGLIARAREDVTQPIPMVFNLASWTEKLTLADWLAQELNNLYSVPRKTAPDWVKGNKLLLLLDGLDEVRQDSRAKCVEAINVFRKDHGLTSLAVCSRSQDYADLNTKLSFEGAIEVQPLTQKQIHEFFNRFGDEMAGIKQVLEKDNALREMAETPLFLSIMIMAYRDKQDVEIWVSQDEKTQRKHLFDTYIERMFERRLINTIFKKQDALHWLSWLASKMAKNNIVPYLLEDMQPWWLNENKKMLYRIISVLLFGLLFGLTGGLLFGLPDGLIFGLGGVLLEFAVASGGISTIDSLLWNWKKARKYLVGWLTVGVIIGLIVGTFFILKEFPGGRVGISAIDSLSWGWEKARIFLILLLGGALITGLFLGLIGGLLGGLGIKQVNQTTYPGQRLVFSAKNFLLVFVISGLLFGLLFGLFFGLLFGLIIGLTYGLDAGLLFGLVFGLNFGGLFPVQHYILRFILAQNNLLPWRLVSFLDHCVDLVFLRRVGGGYIFIHRLLMEHFAEMYVETTK